MNTAYEVLKKKTDSIISVWTSPNEYISEQVKEKIEKIDFKQLSKLVEDINVIADESLQVETKEIVHIQKSLQTIIKIWMQFFLCVHYDTYCENPIYKEDQVIQPEDADYNDLKQFFWQRILNEEERERFKWIEEIELNTNVKMTGDDAIAGLCNFVKYIHSGLPIQ